MSMRILTHPVLGDADIGETVNITVDGKAITAVKGEMIFATLLSQGIIINRYTRKRHEPRGLFCGIGQYTDCMMVVNGRPNVQTCITPVADGMVVETQYGFASRGDNG